MNENFENHPEEQVSQESVEENEQSQEFLDLLEGINSGEGEINAQKLEDNYKEGLISETEFGKLAFELLKKIETQGQEARIDKLTGLNNKRGFDERLERNIQELRTTNEKREHPLQSLMIINLDMNGLKGLNDTYGHSAGNKGLVALANRLKASVKDTDIIARPGGDEFLVLMPIDSTKEDIHDQIFERFQNSLQNLAIEIEDQNGQIINHSISTATGFAVLDKNDLETTSEELLDRADKAMYENKIEMKKSAA